MPQDPDPGMSAVHHGATHTNGASRFALWDYLRDGLGWHFVHESRHNDEDCSDENLTPLEYALRYRLVSSLHSGDRLALLSLSSLAQDLIEDAEDSFMAPSCSTGDDSDQHLQAAMNEKWDVGREFVQFFASTLAFGDANRAEMFDDPDIISFKDLALEEPLLHSDPGIDLERLRRRNKASISTNSMAPLVLSRERGESLAWSGEDMKLHEKTEKMIKSEKFEVSTCAIEYIRQVVGLAVVSEEDKYEVEDIRGLGDNRRKLPMTPTLLPLTPSSSPTPLKGPAGDMQFTSSPADLFAIEAAGLNHRIMEEEIWDHGKMPQSGTEAVEEFLSGQQNDSSSPLQWKRAQDLKLTSPLLPVRSEEPSPNTKAEAVPFTTGLQSFVPSNDEDISLDDLSESMDDFMAQVVMPFAEAALRQSENEQLSEIDTTMRVPVPVIEEVKLTPPWSISASHGLSNDCRQIVMKGAKSLMTEKEKKWAGVSKLQDALPWTAFPARLGQVQEEEEGLDEDSLAEYMPQCKPEDPIDIELLLCKTSGLRILDDQDSDDEIVKAMAIYDGDVEPADLPETVVGDNPPGKAHHAAATPSYEPPQKQDGRMDMKTLLRKRKLELELANDRGRDSKRSAINPAMNVAASLTAVSNEARVDFAGLSGFMRLQGHPLIAETRMTRQHNVVQPPCAPAAVMVEPTSITHVDTDARVPRFAVPELALSLEAKSIIVSATSTMSRHLMRKISKKYPQLTVVEREAVASQHVAVQAKAKGNVTDEADITLSPSTGMILTTLQKLKQKPLPGQSASYGVRERIAAIGTRFERLIVLVSENRPIAGPVNPLDDYDYAALAELIGFGCRLDTDIEIYHVAGGDDQLVQWITAAISRHALSSTNARLLEEQTLWERLLRTAGLNAYAAQAFLGKLQLRSSFPRDDYVSAVGEAHVPLRGLATFMHMSADERIQRFGQLMGGERVLRRANRFIDGSWVSASTTDS